MVEVGRGRGETLVALRACTGVRLNRQMHARNVNLHVGLHPATVVAAGTAPHLVVSDGMRLRGMLVQPALLNKSPIASRYRADILHISCVLLHMVEHRVLALLGYRAERALK